MRGVSTSLPERSAAKRSRKRAARLPAAVMDELVSAIVRQSAVPLGVRQIARRLESKGSRRPAMSIYRSLHRLTCRRAIERVASIPGYRSLDTPKAALMVCQKCGSVTSSAAPALHAQLSTLAAETGFVADHHILEAVGLCRKCRGRKRDR
jgi:Fur family zinc uptake transcriptional regulator